MWVLMLTLIPVALAAPPPVALAEITYLLEFVNNSGCGCYRNGTWYDSKKARAHLQSKYEVLAGGGGISTAEDFIDRAATTSSLSGRPYEVRCRDGVTITSSQWLRGVLERCRSHGAPRALRGALAAVQGRA
jgi:hypothetical protein